MKKRPTKTIRRELRLTRAEAAAQDAAAERAKRTWSDWIRVVANDAANRTLAE
jgi:hypothetical protein